MTRDQAFSILFPILMSCIMTPVMTYLSAGQLFFPKIFLMMAIQSAIALVCNQLFDAGQAGGKMAMKVTSPDSPVPFVLITAIIPTLYFTAILAFTGNLFAMGPSLFMVKTFFRTLPLNLIIGYLISLVIFLILNQATKERN